MGRAVLIVVFLAAVMVAAGWAAVGWPALLLGGPAFVGVGIVLLAVFAYERCRGTSEVDATRPADSERESPGLMSGFFTVTPAGPIGTGDSASRRQAA